MTSFLVIIVCTLIVVVELALVVAIFAPHAVARAVAALVQAVVMRPLRRLLGGRRSAVRPGGAH
jgi:hypothetical protein